MKPNIFSKPNLYCLLILLISVGYAFLHYSKIKVENNVIYSDLFYDLFCNKYVINNSDTYCYDKANLSSGLLLGMANFSSEFKAKFVSLGLIHLIIASGSQINYLANIVQKILLNFYITRKIRFPFIILACLLYIFYIGFAPPLIRGAISYIVINTLSVYWGRYINPIRVLIFTYCIIIIIFPFLLYSISLYLSVLATLGIHINNRYFDSSKIKILYEQLIIVSLTTPIIMLFSKYFNPFSIILNIALSIIIPYLLIILFTSISTVIVYNIGFIVSFIVDSLLVIINGFERLSKPFIIELQPFTTLQFTIYYLTLFFIVITYDYLYIQNTNYKLQHGM